MKSSAVAIGIILSLSVFSAENIFLNPGFTPGAGPAVFDHWQLRNGGKSVAGQGGDSALHIETKSFGKSTLRNNVLAQSFKELQEGRYLLSVYLRFDQTAPELFQSVAYYTPQGGKTVYMADRLTAQNRPESGQWMEYSATFNLPAGKVPVTFAFEIRHPEDGAGVALCRPVLTRLK